MENVNSAKGGRISEKKSAAKNCASGYYKPIPKELVMHDDGDSCKSFMVDNETIAELNIFIAPWVQVGLYLELIDIMRCLDSRLAQKIPLYIGKFCWGMGRTVTGIEHLDNQLLSIYSRIYEQAKAQGKKLEMN